MAAAQRGGRTAPARLRIVALTDLEPADTARWTELRNRAIASYPCADPRLLIPAVRLRPDAQQIRLILVEKGAALLVVMPFIVQRVLRGVPLRAVSSSEPFLTLESGWRHPLVDTENTVEALCALISGLSRLHLPRLVDFSNFPAEGPLYDALQDAAARLHAPIVERDRQEVAFVRVSATATSSPAPEGPSTPASFALAHSPARTRKRAKQARALERELGAELRVDDRSDDPQAIAEFIALQDSGWKGDSSRGGGGLRLSHYEQWFTEVTTAYRTDGDLSVYALRGGDETVYMAIWFRIGDHGFGYADAYDERFARHSAGTLGRIATLNHGLALSRLSTFDPNMSPHYLDSSQLYPHRQQFASYLVASGGFVSRAALRALPLVRRLRARMAR